MFEVIWRQLAPEKREVRRATFTDFDAACREAQTFNLSIPGTAEATVYNERGGRLDCWVRDNA